MHFANSSGLCQAMYAITCWFWGQMYIYKRIGYPKELQGTRAPGMGEVYGSRARRYEFQAEGVQIVTSKIPQLASTAS